MKTWRTGRTIPINVYEDDGPTSRPICQCHTVEDAKLIVAAVNRPNLRVLHEMLEVLELAEQTLSGVPVSQVDIAILMSRIRAAIRKSKGEL